MSIIVLLFISLVEDRMSFDLDHYYCDYSQRDLNIGEIFYTRDEKNERFARSRN
jgi:hypothetical protein